MLNVRWLNTIQYNTILIMFMGFIYRHIKIGVLYVNKPLYDLLSEKIQSFFIFFKIITLFHNAFCYETAK